jgi:diketogulonate reductase-like aldo/keto reductase
VNATPRRSSVRVEPTPSPGQGRSVISRSTKPHRIAENFAVFDFELTADELAAIDALDTDRRGGPEPADVTLERFGREIPEA